MTTLRERMLVEMRIRCYSEHMIVSYVRRVRQFARHFGRSPDLLTEAHARAYLTHLTEKHVKPGVLANTVSAIRFFYRNVMQKDLDLSQVPYPRLPQRLAVVISREDVLRFLDSIENIKHRALITTCYAGGLRASEAHCLRICDIDSKRKVIHVHQGKGRKDRVVPLSETLLLLLREYWCQGTGYLSR